MDQNDRGCVFVDDGGRVYGVRQLGRSLWLCYWHPDKHWVTLRELHPSVDADAAMLAEVELRTLPDDLAQHYHDLHDAYMLATRLPVVVQ